MKRLLQIILFCPLVIFAQNDKPNIVSTFYGIRSNIQDFCFRPDSISSNDSIIILSDDCKFSNAKVESFVLNIVFPNNPAQIEKYIKGNKLSEDYTRLIKNLTPGCHVYIECIKITVDSIQFTSTPVYFKIDGLKACVFTFPDEIEYKFHPCLDTNSKRSVGTDIISKTGTITIKKFLRNEHILIESFESDYDNSINTDFQIFEYEIKFRNKDGILLNTMTEKSDKISKSIKSYIRKNKKRISEIQIDNILARNSTGQNKRIWSLHLTII